MPIKTSRTNENARVVIDYDKCNACGLCANVCKDMSLTIKDKKLIFDGDAFFGCIGCGQCAAICPKEAIYVEGRTVTQSDFVPLPSRAQMADFGQLNNLMLGRRSVRDFKPQEIEPEVIDKIIQAASTAPMGIPPSDVGILVLKGRAKVREFAFDFLDCAKGMMWFFSPVMLALMRPFWGKDNIEMMKSFIVPLFNELFEKQAKGEDLLLYDAPLAMYFYCNQAADPADPVIAATYATLAAESLGLGTCMIGSIAPFLKQATKLKKKYGLGLKTKDGIVVIFGYPKYKYHRAIKRSFAKVATL